MERNMVQSILFVALQRRINTAETPKSPITRVPICPAQIDRSVQKTHS